jgi:hypothetical protein
LATLHLKRATISISVAASFPITRSQQSERNRSVGSSNSAAGGPAGKLYRCIRHNWISLNPFYSDLQKTDATAADKYGKRIYKQFGTRANFAQAKMGLPLVRWSRCLMSQQFYFFAEQII